MGKNKKKAKKKSRAGGRGSAAGTGADRAWKKALAGLASVASRPGVHAAIDDVATLKHLALLRKAEADVRAVQLICQMLTAHAQCRPYHRVFAIADVEGAASASGMNKAIPAPSSATDLPLSGGSAGVCGEARSHSSVMAGFRGWLSDHGIIDESYEIRASKIDGAGNGLFVRGDEEISSGTVVVRVPSRVMLSSLHVQAQRAAVLVIVVVLVALLATMDV